MTDRPPKTEALRWLEEALQALRPLSAMSADAPDFTRWRRNTRVAIKNVFGTEEEHVKEFVDIWFSPMFAPSTAQQERDAYVNGLKNAMSVLQSMMDEVSRHWVDKDLRDAPSASLKNSSMSEKEIFVVHGRAVDTAEAVARFLEKVALEPVILHEQPNEGRTIIEKFEDHANVGFAVVLLTPDDEGRLRAETGNAGILKSRARQNVLLELGFFLGRLGRERTCAIKKGEVEIPSDYKGVVLTVMDDAGAWKKELARELKTAGMDLDLDRLPDA